jgi:hypothetical protein
MICFSLPTVTGESVTGSQPAAPREAFCWSKNPVEDAGQAMITEFVVVNWILNKGEPELCTAVMIPQKPPSSLKLLPVNTPASG